MKKLLARVLLGTLLALGAVTLIGAPAHAAATVGVLAAAAAPEIVLALDLPQLLNLLIAVVFPVLVGLVTRKVTKSSTKAVLLATLSLLSGLVSAFLAAITAGVPFNLGSALLTGFAAWIIAIATHFGIWRPTGVTDAVQAIGERRPYTRTN